MSLCYNQRTDAVLSARAPALTLATVGAVAMADESLHPEIEVWKTVPGFPDCEVSSLGRVRNSKRGKLRRLHRVYERGRLKRLTVVISRDATQLNHSVHRLVLLTFVGPCPEGLEGCHNDGDASNNRISNLRWDTHKSNVQDSIRHGTYPRTPRTWGPTHRSAKLTTEQVTAIKAAPKYFGHMSELARQFGVSPNCIRGIMIGRTRVRG